MEVGVGLFADLAKFALIGKSSGFHGFSGFGAIDGSGGDRPAPAIRGRIVAIPARRVLRKPRRTRDSAPVLAFVGGAVRQQALRPTDLRHASSNSLPNTSPASVGAATLNILSQRSSGSLIRCSRRAFTFSSTLCSDATMRSALDSGSGISLMISSVDRAVGFRLDFAGACVRCEALKTRGGRLLVKRFSSARVGV